MTSLMYSCAYSSFRVVRVGLRCPWGGRPDERQCTLQRQLLGAPWRPSGFLPAESSQWCHQAPVCDIERSGDDDDNAEIAARALRDHPPGERLVFINAWNEWAEAVSSRAATRIVHRGTIVNVNAISGPSRLSRAPRNRAQAAAGDAAGQRVVRASVQADVTPRRPNGAAGTLGRPAAPAGGQARSPGVGDAFESVARVTCSHPFFCLRRKRIERSAFLVYHDVRPGPGRGPAAPIVARSR